MGVSRLGFIGANLHVEDFQGHRGKQATRYREERKGS